ncbi:hypothetical protein Molly5_40 [Maribacter phage Molly_5]|uniref:Methyltransferase n=1 Tax=Maribacter phage Molly_1 TaxID=2745685 RepID=A0A8E4UYD8_9CAUD|nr:hypothetical protein M1M29_gp040 [Maribacter phage Molly_1]QQO97723.1 hypothetical protein Molly2_40 [Maribacter phage Molly_2]QQO97923.1 hypothetical protein Molly3_40 [Maribacter phage Molly_3]QQO98123.1 hypothetical protein Molly4_40 [Maribacter phage Molly_4]QQO98323.1 hypothetical protein Molly5_40 [Maribacter phage Molly_5]QQO97523.1 hypothetical protein Molly1_40 [Maribacter phage Molly_1]
MSNYWTDEDLIRFIESNTPEEVNKLLFENMKVCKQAKNAEAIWSKLYEKLGTKIYDYTDECQDKTNKFIAELLDKLFEGMSVLDIGASFGQYYKDSTKLKSLNITDIAKLPIKYFNENISPTLPFPNMGHVKGIEDLPIAELDSHDVIFTMNTLDLIQPGLRVSFQGKIQELKSTKYILCGGNIFEGEIDWDERGGRMIKHNFPEVLVYPYYKRDYGHGVGIGNWKLVERFEVPNPHDNSSKSRPMFLSLYERR